MTTPKPSPAPTPDASQVSNEFKAALMHVAHAFANPIILGFAAGLVSAALIF